LSFVHSVISGTDSAPFATFVTEIVDKKDPRATSPKMTAAREKDLRGLIERGAFEVVLLSKFLWTQKSSEVGLCWP
jgi:hypothetical protein